MDHRWVDWLARGLAERRTRRDGIVGAVAALFAASGVRAEPAEAGRAGAAGRRGRRRARCRPACLDGYACLRGECRCASGVACGDACCAAGQACVEGTCTSSPPPACIGFGQPCKGVGRPCCEGLACGSGPGGMTDIGCYRPAGAGCQTTGDCVFGSVCTDGVCVAIPVPPPCTVCPSGCVYDSVAKAVAEAAPGATVTVADGVYDAPVTIDKDLTLEACDGGRPVIRNGPPSEFEGVLSAIQITAGRVTLRGLRISCSTCDTEDGTGGGLVVASPTALGAATRAARRLGSAHDIVADPRRTMRLGRAAFSAARAAAREDAPPPEVRAIDCEISGVRFPEETVAAVAIVGASLNLTDSLVRDNEGILGGGVLVIGGTVVLDGDTEVSGNQGLIGSGVFALGDCIAGNPFGAANVIMRDRARITGNRARPEAVTVPSLYLGGGGVTLWSAAIEMTGDSAVERNQSFHIGGGIAVLSGQVTLGCDDCPGTVRVAENVAMGVADPAYGGGVALLGYNIAPVETSDARLTVRASARIVDNVAYGPASDTSIPGAGGGIFAAESTGAVEVDMTTAATGADPAVTRNHAVPSGAVIGGGRNLIVGVGGVFYDADPPTPAKVPGVTLLAINGNEGDQCGGDLTPLCTLPG